MCRTLLALTLMLSTTAFAQPKTSEKAEVKPETKSAAKEPAKMTSWSARARNGDVLYATLQTSLGDIQVRLFSKDAPRTVENFVALASGEKTWTDPKTGQKTQRPLYDGTIFHRVIPNFMIQGGDPLGEGTGGPGYEFEDEFQSAKTFDKPCVLAMANAGPNTNGSQFFITEKATPWLNKRHTIFGEVVKGCELVAKIARVPSEGSRPNETIVIKKVVLSDR
jgi:peptidyl-prolyl cis-trans isomerase A (cyclophilin A)